MSHFVDLHLHSCWSLLDGLIKPGPLMEKCKELGRGAVALTDHGSMGGLVEFHGAAVKAGIKPILGMEAYHDKGGKDNYHLVLLARTREGYENLVKLNNEAQANIYKKARVNDDMLKEHGAGIICLTGCMHGYLPQTVIAGKPDWDWYHSACGWFDAVYLEVQNHQIPEEQIITKAFMDSGLPVVGTTDAHYLNLRDKTAHEVGLAISMNKKAGEFKFNGTGYHVRPRTEIDLPARALDTTVELAATVEQYELGHKVWQLPKIELDPERELALLEFELDDYLATKFGFDEKDGKIALQADRQQYRDRLKYEFKVISDNGFLPYFMIVSDLCRFIDSRGKLRGWGRGSAAGSLVAMLYGITKIDPIQWGLYFERFLNPDRISPPDIDLDFQPDDREPVMEYLRQKYGRVYQIGTYTTLGSKEVLRSCSRAMGVNTELDEYVPVEAPVPSISELMTREAFARQVKAERNEDFIEVCLALEGLPRNRSAHASGVVIDETGEIPYQISKSGTNAGLPITSYDMYSLESQKFVKIDVLGVNMLAIIDRACKSSGVRIEDMALDDKLTFDRFNEGYTMGVFQFETHSFAKIIKDLHPDSFDELVDLNTLGRPGCLESGMTDEYIKRKKGEIDRVPIHQCIGLTGKHQELPLFQEQMMEIARLFAGFTMSQADTLRKAIGKKQKDLMDSLRQSFVEGAIGMHGVTEAEAASVWETLEKSARYTWNLSHAVAYTMISYWTMWLSANKPVEFMCELINGASEAGRRRTLLSECARRGIPLEHPLINEAEREPCAKGGRIILGLSGIKYVGGVILDSILEARKSGPFLSSADLKTRTKANKRHVEYLLKAGCFPEEHMPSRDDELDAIGYSIFTRVLNMGHYKYLRNLAEVIDVRAITTKRGDPMCFLSVETHDGIESVTVFPKLYAQVKEALKPGAILGLRLDGDILIGLFDPDDLSNMKVTIPEDRADEFMSFMPSCKGEPNIFAGGMGISKVDLSQEMLSFIGSEFGIEALQH